jgi:hypothetical protein
MVRFWSLLWHCCTGKSSGFFSSVVNGLGPRAVLFVPYPQGIKTHLSLSLSQFRLISLCNVGTRWNSLVSSPNMKKPGQLTWWIRGSTWIRTLSLIQRKLGQLTWKFHLQPAQDGEYLVFLQNSITSHFLVVSYFVIVHFQCDQCIFRLHLPWIPTRAGP